MREWSVHLDSRHRVRDRDRLYDLTDHLLEALKGRGAVASPGARNLGVAFNVHAHSAAAGIAKALKIFSAIYRRVGFPGRPVIFAAEIQTVEEQIRRLQEPSLPPFVGITEVAGILGVTRQRAHQLTRAERFPKPLAELAAGPIWNRHAIDRFAETWPRLPGRPRLLRSPDASKRAETRLRVSAR